MAKELKNVVEKEVNGERWLFLGKEPATDGYISYIIGKVGDIEYNGTPISNCKDLYLAYYEKIKLENYDEYIKTL